MRIAVYSVYCGATRALTLSSAKVDPVFPHFYFTNNGEAARRAASYGWTPHLMNITMDANPTAACMQAKGPKVMPWQYEPLDKFDVLIFRDDKMPGVDFGMLPRILERMKAAGAYAAYPVHPRNVIEEILDSMPQPRYFAQRAQIAKFVADELESGGKPRSPVHFGCNVIVRDMHHPETRLSGARWMQYIGRCGIQDQISMHFVAQVHPDILPIPQEFGLRPSEVAVPGW